MVCYRVDIPDGVTVSGVTADGAITTVMPGEYLVHELPQKVPSAKTLFRFVGADAAGRDVHVPHSAFRCFLHASSPQALHVALVDAA